MEATFDKQLQLSGIIEPWVIEYKFNPEKPRSRLDYYFPRIHLGVEIQGGTWINGGHSRGSGMKRDIEKKQVCLLQGIWLLELDCDMVNNWQGIDVLKLAIEKLSNDLVAK